MDIKIDKLISGSNGTLACVSDETILAVGKRYFELASGQNKPKELDDIVKEARDIKDYCNGHSNCDNCPLYSCADHHCIVSGTPGGWEVPV